MTALARLPHLPPMRRTILPALLAAACFTAPAHAQATYYAQVGLTGSSKIVRDVILTPVETRPGIAPTLFLGGELPIGPRYRMGLELSAATASLTTRTPAIPGSDLDQGRITTIGAMLNLAGPVAPHLQWRGGIGLLRYNPSEQSGIFAQGGTTRALFGAGLDFRQPAGRRWDAMISTRFDYHRFSTDELRHQGFTLQQGVRRLSVSVGLARAAR